MDTVDIYILKNLFYSTPLSSDFLITCTEVIIAQTHPIIKHNSKNCKSPNNKKYIL